MLDLKRFGLFDRVVMNPPFHHGADIAHMERATARSRSGGRLVAICANGPLQLNRLMLLTARYDGCWQDLPAKSFKHAGTMGNTALLVINV